MMMDWTILQWIQENMACDVLDAMMPAVTRLGDMGVVWVAIALAMICSHTYHRQGILLLVGLGIGVLVGNVLLKNLIARPRPCWLDTGVSLLIANPTDYSFPSGHTLSSVIAATLLTLSHRSFGYAAIPLAALIAFSRLYLYVHFPSDILGATLLGLSIGILVYRVGNLV